MHKERVKQFVLLSIHTSSSAYWSISLHTHFTSCPYKTNHTYSVWATMLMCGMLCLNYWIMITTEIIIRNNPDITIILFINLFWLWTNFNSQIKVPSTKSTIAVSECCELPLLFCLLAVFIFCKWWAGRSQATGHRQLQIIQSTMSKVRLMGMYWWAASLEPASRDDRRCKFGVHIAIPRRHLCQASNVNQVHFY